MRTIKISVLRRIENLLLKAEEELADFENCPVDMSVYQVNEACKFVENARDELLKIVDTDYARQEARAGR